MSLPFNVVTDRRKYSCLSSLWPSLCCFVSNFLIQYIVLLVSSSPDPVTGFKLPFDYMLSYLFTYPASFSMSVSTIVLVFSQLPHGALC
jgi:hypothetical protein